MAVVVFIPFIFTLHFSACLLCQSRTILKVLFYTMDNGFLFSICHTLLGREILVAPGVELLWDFV